MLYQNAHLLQIRPASQQWVAGADMRVLPELKDAWLLTQNGRIKAFGPMSECPQGHHEETLDCTDRILMPAWCDSHSHLVYAGNRESEWMDRLNGLTYEQVAARGGGIINSAQLLNETPEEEIYQQSKLRLQEVISLGTGALEIKSGYGLTLEGELKMLRVIRRLKEEAPIPIRATFLAAHALPTRYKDDKAAYLQLVIDEMLPRVAGDGLADYIDVFCEKGYFDIQDTELLMEAGARYGLPAKIHVNQFNAFGGVAAAVRHGALSVDHLEELDPVDVRALAGSKTMPVALPGCSFFLGIPYTPGRTLIDAGLPLALATDFNPGSAPSGNMNLVVALACNKMKLTPEEAINAATLNGAYAMGLSSETGSITVGKRTNLILTKRNVSVSSFGYRFGSPLIQQVIEQ